MLEVVNGFLLVYFLILCTLSSLVPYIVKPIAVCFSRPSQEDRKVYEEMRKLKAEQSGISMKDEFAAYSKLQRKIFQLESSLKNNSQSRISKSLAIKGSVHFVLQVVLAVLMLASVIWFRREPIVTLKGNLLPFETILRYPSNKPNAISTHMWVLISNVSIRTILKPFV